MDESSLNSDFFLKFNQTNSKNKLNLLLFGILLVVCFVIIICWNKSNVWEGMSGGTLTQLFAQDSQDVYLKSNVDKIATGNWDLYWNQPTRIANTYMNRGSPLSTFILPNTPMNPNARQVIVPNNSSPNNSPNNLVKKSYSGNQSANSLRKISNPQELEFVGKQVAKTSSTTLNLPKLTEMKPRDYLYDLAYDNLLYNKDCLGDPASCGSGSGGFRLGEDYVRATRAKPYVSIDGNYFYPDSYVGSYFIEPNFDISRPIPFMPSSNLPPSPVRMG
jgi:hypothetical protein